MRQDFLLKTTIFEERVHTSKNVLNYRCSITHTYYTHLEHCEYACSGKIFHSIAA